MADYTALLIQYLPWFISIIVIALALFYLIRQMSAQRHFAASLQSNAERLAQENAILNERLVIHETNMERERQEAARHLETLSSEKSALGLSFEELRKEHGQVRAKLAGAETRLPQIEELTRERDTLRRSLDAVRQEKSDIQTNLAALRTQMEEEGKTAREKIQLLEMAEHRLSKEFENLANRIFEEKHQKFSEVSKTSVEALLNPVRQQLTDFRKKVEDVYDQENKERASLRTEIHLLKSLNERISAEALNLTRALKGGSKTRGSWGEMQLERLLEESGLTKGREYEVQVSLKDEDGKRLQPDVVIHLPEKRDVVIDSKVTLVAYEQYHSAEDDGDRQRQLRHHINSLRTHFNGLSAKSYDELVGVNSLDLVIMFVPIEPALLLALESEPSLFNEAFNRGILLVSPSTLMATLQIIHNIWRYECQNQNALQIATEAGRLYDHFVLFVEALEKVGDQLKKASESYDTAHKRLSSGRGNLIDRTHKLQELGAKTKKHLPTQLLEAAAAEDEELDAALLEAQTIEETTA